jgi:cysteine synthase
MKKDPLDMIGNTPLLRLKNIEPEGVELYAKMESENLSGSIKARTALAMIDDAEKRGLITPNCKDSSCHLLEPTSGNTGIALAAISTLRGYKFTAVVSKSVTEERVNLLKAYGAEIVFSSAEGGSNEAIKVAEELAKDKKYTMLNQYENPANPLAHYKTTAREIIDDLPDLTTFVAGLGTGGTLAGAGKRLLEHNPDIQIVAAEPMPGDAVQGLRSLEEGYIPPVYDPSVLTRKLLISSRDSIFYTRLLLKKEALFVGVSAGSNLAAALRVADPKTNNKIVFIVPDGGARYLSTGIFDVSDEDIDKFEVYGWW